MGVPATQVDFERIEVELGDELAVDQLALVPGRVLLHHVAIRLVLVAAKTEPRLLQRVADIEVGPTELVIAEFEAEAEETRSEAQTSELQSLMRISYAVFCVKKKILQSRSNDTYYD